MKKFIILTLLAILTLFLSSCDLGYESDQKYGEAFKVNFIKEDRSKYYEDDGVDITEFYNKESTNDFKTSIPNDKYKYLVITPTSDVEISELYFYAMSEKEERLRFNLYVVDNLPSVYGNLDEALKKFAEFLSNPEGEFEFNWGDEPSDHKITATSGQVTSRFTDFGFLSFNIDEEMKTSFKVKEGQHILIQIENNCDTGVVFTRDMTLEEAKNAVKERRANAVPINITNLLIRVIG